MSVRTVKAGTTDVSVILRIIDSADGTPETGVVYNTSGIDLWYRREGAASVDITEATLSALTDAHSDGGFLHINDGWYRLDLPDAACATTVTGVQIGGTVTGMVVLAPYIELVTYAQGDVNVVAISGDATAADNLESYLDGSEFMPVDAHKQKFTVTGGTLQPKKPDDTTNTGYSRTVGTDPAAEPIVSST